MKGELGLHVVPESFRAPHVDEPFAGSGENIITYEDHAVHGIVETVSVTLTPNANSG